MDRFDRLLEIASDAHKLELTIRHNAHVKCLRDYNSDPTAGRDRDLAAAKKGLEELMDRLWPVYFPEEDRFKNLLEAMKHLKGLGYKIGKSKIYKDAKDRQIRVQADGAVLKRDAEAYAKTLKLLGDPLKGLEAAQARKAELEIERLEHIMAGLKRERDIQEGRFVLAEDSDLEKANNAGAIFVALSNVLLNSARELIEACAGDQRRIEIFIEAVKQQLERAANSLSKMEEFEVIFGGKPATSN